MKIIISLILILIFISCSKNQIFEINIYSDAFENLGSIPLKYTCQGDDISPPIQWNNIPENTKSLVLIMDDPDAPIGTWVHWILYDIPPQINTLKENIEKKKFLEFNMKQGLNSAKYIGYQGPCPPNSQHRYFFKIYALDTVLNIEKNITKNEIMKLMNNHIIGYGELIGLYKKIKNVPLP